MVLCGQDTEISARPVSGERQVDCAVCCERVYQLVLKNVQAVAQTDHDIAAYVLLCLQKQSVRALGRVSGGQQLDLAVDFLQSVFGQQRKYPSKPPL